MSLLPRFVLLSCLLAGCAGESSAPPASQAAPAPFNAAGLPTTLVSVPGIDCEGCAMGVRNSLEGLAGVKEVDVDVATKTATLAIDPAEIDKQAVLDALSGANFDGASFVTEGTTSPQG